MHSKGKIFVVGLGAITKGSLTFDAFDVLTHSDYIVGYTSYVNQLQAIMPDLKYIKTGMKKEVERIYKAIELAKSGNTVSVICSGDAGIYAMAGLLFEILEKEQLSIEVEVIPGIPALAICSAVLGAPLMNDFAVISFSNLLTPEEVIVKRLKAFLDADVVIVIYNPVSKGRRELFNSLWNIILENRADFYAGYVKNGGRDNEYFIGKVAEMPVANIDMNSLIVIGNTATKIVSGRLVTTRGYRI